MKRYTIRVGKSDSVFVLEDSEARMAWFRKRCPNLVHAESADEAIKILATKQFDWVFLDHDLGLLDYTGYTAHGNGTGRDVAKYLSGTNWLADNCVIHSWNPMGAAAMKDILIGASAIPFGQFEIELV